MREGYTVGRVGGDEFVVIVEPWNRGMGMDAPMSSAGISSSDQLMALRVADRVVRVLHGPMRLEGLDHEITVSVGMSYPSLVTLGGGTDITAADILAEADAAIYQAKNLGKCRFEVFATGHSDTAGLLPIA